MLKTVLTNFKYHQSPEGQFFPVIPLRFYLSKKVVDSSALVDSGATISIFRGDVADFLGLHVQRGKEIFLSGVGGRIKGYVHKVKIETAGKGFICPIVFSYEFTVSFNLLGREGFFKHFQILFDEKRKQVSLK